VALISISLAFSKTPAYTARPWTQCIAWCACLRSSFRWYSLHLPTEGWPGWVVLGGWLHTKNDLLVCRQSPIQVVTGPGID